MIGGTEASTVSTASFPIDTSWFGSSAAETRILPDRSADPSTAFRLPADQPTEVCLRRPRGLLTAGCTAALYRDKRLVVLVVSYFECLSFYLFICLSICLSVYFKTSVAVSLSVTIYLCLFSGTGAHEHDPSYTYNDRGSTQKKRTLCVVRRSICQQRVARGGVRNSKGLRQLLVLP